MFGHAITKSQGTALFDRNRSAQLPDGSQKQHGYTQSNSPFPPVRQAYAIGQVHCLVRGTTWSHRSGDLLGAVSETR